MTAAGALSGLALVDLDRGRHARGGGTPGRGAGPLSGVGACVGRRAHVRQSNLPAPRGGRPRRRRPGGRGPLPEEAERRQRAQSFAWGLSETLRYLGDLARTRGDLDAALGCYRESLALAGERGDPRLTAAALDGVAGLAAVRGQAERAARLHGAAAALREHLGATVVPWEHPAASATWRRCGRRWNRPHSKRLGRPERRCRWRRPSPRRWLIRIPSPAPAARPGPAGPADALGLTPREIDVLRLLAHGHSNREIGEALFISPRTVNFHVINLLAKLELDSRAAPPPSPSATGWPEHPSYHPVNLTGPPFLTSRHNLVIWTGRSGDALASWGR